VTIGSLVLSQPQVLGDHAASPGSGLACDSTLPSAIVLIAFGLTGRTASQEQIGQPTVGALDRDRNTVGVIALSRSGWSARPQALPGEDIAEHVLAAAESEGITGWMYEAIDSLVGAHLQVGVFGLGEFAHLSVGDHHDQDLMVGQQTALDLLGGGEPGTGP
jgi:hypothetical protein